MPCGKPWVKWARRMGRSGWPSCHPVQWRHGRLWNPVNMRVYSILIGEEWDGLSIFDHQCPSNIIAMNRISWCVLTKTSDLYNWEIMVGWWSSELYGYATWFAGSTVPLKFKPMQISIVRLPIDVILNFIELDIYIIIYICTHMYILLYYYIYTHIYIYIYTHANMIYNIPL